MEMTPNDNPLIGLTVADVRPMTDEERDAKMWDHEAVVIEFDDGSSLFAMRDPEGNGPGTICHKVGNQTFYV